MLSVKQGSVKYYFLVFAMTWPRIEPRSPEPLANTLLIRPIHDINYPSLILIVYTHIYRAGISERVEVSLVSAKLILEQGQKYGMPGVNQISNGQLTKDVNHYALKNWNGLD